MTKNKLTDYETWVVEQKGTERPFSGLYTSMDMPGVYLCKRCETPLYRSQDKFPSHCGWPSFDDEIAGAVARYPDADGQRVEIVCKACNAHLGHVFEGEGFTPKNIRHCVNSVSLKFVPAESVSRAKAVFASGCFWGTQYFLGRLAGVVQTKVGYSGGHIENPQYEQVCRGDTGHYEAVEVTYDPSKVSYEALVRLFFETHDFTQTNGQGPDIGPQYRSAIFYQDEAQRKIAEDLVHRLEGMGYQVATELKQAERFWEAETYHQDYYERKGDTPYCHAYRKVFPES